MFNEGIKSEHTRKVYSQQIDSFLTFTRIKDYDSLLELSREHVQVMLEDYVIHIKKKVNPNTVPIMMTGVKHFFDMNDVYIN